MRSGSIAVTAVLLSGCGAQISGDVAGGDASAVDASPAGDSDAAPSADAMPALCAARSVYLNFDGQTLTRGRSDATTNHAEWMLIEQGTAPPYLAGDANRAAAIEAIVTGVRTQLARFPIAVATTRPASGSYVMIVFGGQRTAVGSRFGGAVNRLDCDDSRPSDVAWISDGVAPIQRVVNTAIGAIGFGLGLTATLDPKDCMCGWDNGCQPDGSVACTLGSPIARDPAANQLCPGAAPEQDEVATLRAAFCGA
jgi:hypothetical protein